MKVSEKKGGVTLSVKENDGTHAAIITRRGGLTEKQIEAAEMLQSGEYLNKQVADIVGVHYNTITQWLKKPKFQEKMREIAKEHRERTLHMLNGATPVATEKLIELINGKDDRLAFEAAKYVIDRELGKTTAKIEVANPVEHTLEINIDDEVKRIMSGDTEIPADAIEVDYTDISD